MEFKLNVTQKGAGACFNLLNTTEAKSPSAVRNHERIYRNLRAGCCEKGTVPDEFGRATEGDVCKKDGGTLVMGDTIFKYLKEILNKKVDAGIPGPFSEGYVNLMDAVDAADEAMKKTEPEPATK